MSGTGDEHASMGAAVAALWEEARPRAGAHRLAGSLGTFGVPEGSTIARELERRIEDGPRQADAPALAEQVLALRRPVEAGWSRSASPRSSSDWPSAR